VKRTSLPLLALLLGGCGILRQVHPSWTLESEHVRLRVRREVFDAAVTAAAIDVSGRYAALGSYNGALALFDLEDRELVGTLFRVEGRPAGVAGIEASDSPATFEALLTDGRLVDLRAGREPSVRGEATRPSAGTPSCRVLRRQGVAYRVAPRSPETIVEEPRATAATLRGETLVIASGASPGTYLLTVFEGGRPRFETALGSTTVSLALHPELPEVAAGGAGELSVFDFQVGARLSILAAPGSVLVAYDPRGRFLYALHGEHLSVLSPDGGQVLADLSAHRSASLAIAVSPDGSTIVTGGTRGAIRIWEVR